MQPLSTVTAYRRVIADTGAGLSSWGYAKARRVVSSSAHLRCKTGSNSPTLEGATPWLLRDAFNDARTRLHFPDCTDTLATLGQFTGSLGW